MIGLGTARRILDATWERLFGFDIFITYTRRDGEAYATALKRALGAVTEQDLRRVASEVFAPARHAGVFVSLAK